MSLYARIAGSRFAAWYWAAWNQVHGLLAIAFLLRFSVIIAAIAAFGLAVPEQAVEALRVAAEDATHTITPLVALGAGVLFVCLMVWYWARILLYLLRPDLFGAESPRPGTTWTELNAAYFLPRLFGAVPMLGAAIGFWRAAERGAGEDGARALLRVLAVSAVAAGFVLYALLVVRGRMARRHHAVHADVHGEASVFDLGASTLLALALTLLLSLGLFLCFTKTTGQAARSFGATAIVMLALGSWIPPGSLCVWLGKLLRLPVLLLVVAAAASFSAFDLNDDHEVRHELPPAPVPGFRDAFDAWLANRADLHRYPKTYPVFLVSAEGGGLRAAYFTAIVLAAIQERCPAFAQHVFAISGVSGGSVGASVFAALAAREARNEAESPCEFSPVGGRNEWTERTDRVLQRDLLSPLMAMALYPDLSQRFLPFPVGRFDRARALEVGIEEAWTEGIGGDAFAAPFLGLWASFPQGATPALFLNTTNVESGERTVVTNLALEDPRFSRLRNFAELDPRLSLRLSTAAFLSARFPGVTPAGYIIAREEKQRYVDGGYFEVSGTATLYDILAAMRVGEPEPSGSAPRPAFEPVVLRIGNFLQPLTGPIPEPDRPMKVEVQADRSKFQTQGLGEIMSPVRALLNTREARGASAVRQLVTAIATLKANDHDAAMLPFELREERVPLPLGWLLSQQARDDMKNQLGGPALARPDDGCAFQDAAGKVHNDCAIRTAIAFVRSRGGATP